MHLWAPARRKWQGSTLFSSAHVQYLKDPVVMQPSAAGLTFYTLFHGNADDR
jgi:hypothetical protein